MAKAISVVNLKGGVGKTAIAVNFSAYCAREGMRTLLIDLDPQTNATFSCLDVEEWEEHASKKGTVANLFNLRTHTSADNSNINPLDIIVKGVLNVDKLDLLPSHLDLFTIDLDISGQLARETKLRRAILPIMDDYDIIVCDCPPNLTIPTQNALALSTNYIVPISPDYLSGIGVGLLIGRVRRFCEELQQTLKLSGIIISRVGRPAISRYLTIETIRDRFKNDVVSTEITERVAVANSAQTHVSIYDMNDRDAAKEFTEMSKEVLERI